MENINIQETPDVNINLEESSVNINRTSESFELKLLGTVVEIDTIADIDTIRENAAHGESAYNTIQTYGDIVTHNVSEFATAAQGALADSALQPGDNISELYNDSGFISGITSSDVTTALGYTPADSASLATVATSGSYDDLTNKPTIPTTTNSVTSGSTAALTSGGAYTALQGCANTSLSNLSSDGQMIVDTHNSTISNCILEIPQNIKVELSNNVLTLKAGSILVWGGDTYVTTTTTQDKSYTIPSSQAQGRYFSFAARNTGALQGLNNIVKITSGTTAQRPEWSLSIANTVYFDVDTKTFYYATSTQWIEWVVAYPLCVIDVDENGVASLDIVFNGAGYIGHHVFVYPNVKLLTPNGYNADGTLKSSLETTSALQISELSGSNNSIDVLSGGTLARRNFKEVETLDNTWTGAQYVKSENITYLYSGGNYVVRMETPIVSYVYTGSTVTSFTIVQPVKVATIDMLGDYATTASLATVATSGSYNDLTNKPTIPTVNNATLTIQKNSTDVATFTANASSNVTANISVPTDTGDLTNGAGFITGITSSNVTTALGYTPANSASLATVATSGSYNDLTNKPTIPAAQVNSDWNANSGVAEILNKPTLGTMAAESASDYTKTSGLATVATTGDYDDLLDKPTLGTMAAESASDYTKTSGLAAVALSGAYSDLSGTPSLATVATSGSYSDLSNKPTIPTTTDNVTSGSTAALTSGGAYTALQSYATTNAIANMQTTTNLVTSVSSSSTDSQYPSAKLFYDTVGDIETLINAL